MTLEEKKAKAYAENKWQTDVMREASFDGYLAGSKENGVVWHNLKENPDDLPKDHYIKQAYNQFDGYVRAWYNEEKDEWISENGLKYWHGSIEQWCELPTL